MENFESKIFRNKQERDKTREVFTDETVVIGPQDEALALEAFVVSCALFVVVNKKDGIIGISHLSLGSKQEGIDLLIEELNIGLKNKGTKLEDCERHLFDAGEIIEKEIKNSLSEYGQIIPEIEDLPLPGLRIDKKSGEITFFHSFED